MASPPHIQTYHITSSSGQTIIANAHKLLKPHLPTCLPLYRRLQFGRFTDASVLLTNLPLESHSSASTTNGTHNPSNEQQEPWLMAFVDRSSRPETEVLFFANWEAGSLPKSEANGDGTSDQAGNSQAIDALMLAVLAAMKNLEVPTSIHQDAAPVEDTKDSVGLSRKDYGGHMADPAIMLWGAIHERSMDVLKRLDVVSFAYKAVLTANWTFVWDVDELRKRQSTELPAGLRWGDLRREDLGLVRSRTQIPRQERTLAALPSVGIYPVDDDQAPPVAWVFIGLDGSLTSLHVEEEWRGRGLAKAITTKVFADRMDRFHEADGTTKWGHGFVMVGNKQSEGMCRSLGGRSDYESYWARVDIDKV